MKHLLSCTLLTAALLLWGCKSTYYVSNTAVAYDRIAEVSMAEDTEVEALLAPFRQELAAEMDKVIGHMDTLLIKESPESSIGNWLSDMLLSEASLAYGRDLDFAVQNSGGIRVTSMGAGPITVGEVIEVMPFDNKITIMTADGYGVKEFFDHMAKGRGWPISGGVSYKIKDKKATEIMIKGAPLDLTRIYYFALPDYIAGGGSGSGFLQKHHRQDLAILIRDAFIAHITRDTKAGINQYARKEGRVINLDHE